jgi:RNA polymerase nonessential primary-like sigma factor
VAGLWNFKELRKVVKIVLGIESDDLVLPTVAVGNGKVSIYPETVFDALVVLENRRLDEICREGVRHHLSVNSWYRKRAEEGDLLMLKEASLEPLDFLRRVTASYQANIEKRLNQRPAWEVGVVEESSLLSLMDECSRLIVDLDRRYYGFLKRNEERTQLLFDRPTAKVKHFSSFRGFLLKEGEERLLLRMNDEYLKLQGLSRPNSDKGVLFDQIVKLTVSARKHLVLANVGIVFMALSELVGLGEEIVDDLIQDGLVAVMNNALGGFDIRKGHRFATYAKWWAFQAIERSLSQKYFESVRLPYNVVGEIRAAEAQWQAVVGANGRIDEVVALEKETARLLRGGSKYQESLDIDDLPREMEPSVSGISLDDIEGDRLTYALNSCLTVQEKEIVELRFGLISGVDLPLEEVGRILKISRTTVRTIEKRAQGKLREHLLHEAI